MLKDQGVPEISVVVPAYNEEERLQTSLPHLWRALARRFVTFEIVVVDDGSSDKTAEVVARFVGEYYNVRLISYPHNRGKGYAVRRGVLASSGAYVLFSDADLSTPVREVCKLMAAMGEGYDIAIGSRAKQSAKILKYQPLYRVCMGKTFNKLVRILTVSGIHDTQCGFKCFTQAAAHEIFRQCRIDGFSFDVEMLYLARRKGLRVKEVGVLWRNSPLSRVHPVRHSLQMLRDLFVIRLYGLLGYYGGQGASCVPGLRADYPDKPHSTLPRP